MNVAKDIAQVARKQGHTPVCLDYLANAEDVRRMCDAAVIVMTFNPMLARSWFMLYRELKRRGVPAVFYTTTEGRLPRRYVLPWMKRDLEVVANSLYTKSKIEEVGVAVIDVVLHGFSPEDVEVALKYRNAVRRELESKVGKGVIIGVVASGHPRKGHKFFGEVVRLVRQEVKEALFYIITTPAAATFYMGTDGVFVDTDFGNRGKSETLAYIAAFDFLAHPSLAEGFGLPVLEANALGVPAIHLAYPPLVEFSDPKLNYWVNYKQLIFDSFGEGIDYELHLYDPTEFAKAIVDAVKFKLDAPDEYEARREELRKAVAKYSIYELYPKLLSYIKLVY